MKKTILGAIFGIFVIAILGNYINKMLLLTYEVRTKNVIETQSEDQYLYLVRYFEKLSKVNNSDYYFKSTGGYIGETLGTKNQLSYEFVNFGFCNYRECVSVSNDFKPNEFQIFYYDNWIVRGEKSKQFTEKISHMRLQ